MLRQTLFPLILGASLPLGCASSSRSVPEDQDASVCVPQDDPTLAPVWRVVVREVGGEAQTFLETDPARNLASWERNASPAEMSRLSAAQSQSYRICYGPAGGAERPAYFYQGPDHLDHPCTGDPDLRPLPTDLRGGEALSLIRFARLTDSQYCVDRTSRGVRLSLHAERPQIQAMMEGLRRDSRERTPVITGGRADELIHSLATYLSPQAPATVHGGSSDKLYTLFLLASIVLAVFYIPFRLAQAYLLAAPLGLTREWDPFVARLLRLLGKSKSQFLVDMKALANAGSLRPAIGRETDFEDFANHFYTESGKIPVVIGDTGEGKSRFLEGLIHQIYHDRRGHHYESPEFRRNDCLFPDFDPKSTMVYRLSLRDLHANNSVLSNILWNEFMLRVEGHIKKGERVLILVDEITRIYGTQRPSDGGHAINLVTMIHDWIDHHLEGNPKLRVIGATTVGQYREYIYDFERYEETRSGDPSLGRRLPHWRLPPMAGNHLQRLVDASCEAWERRNKVPVVGEARARVLELSRHPRIGTKNPSAVQDLLDTIFAHALRRRAKGETVAAIDAAFVHDVYARRHHLNPEDVRAWPPSPEQSLPGAPAPSVSPPSPVIKAKSNGHRPRRTA